MKFHIVRNKETLEDILYIYNLTKDELVEQNKHIRVWDKLIPGTKLKIPAIPDAVELEVSDIEPFVEDYYPKISEDTSTPVIKVEEDFKKIEDEEIVKNIDNDKNVSKEDIVEEAKPLSSKIYEDYEDLKNVNEEQKISKPKIQEDYEDEEILTHFSNMQPKPILNNYYPYYLGIYNAPRYIPYPIIYYPVYYPKKPN